MADAFLVKLPSDKSHWTLVMISQHWCCQATSHYLSQFWHTPVLPYGVTRPQWVKELYDEKNRFWWFSITASYRISPLNVTLISWCCPHNWQLLHENITNCLLCQYHFIVICLIEWLLQFGINKFPCVWLMETYSNGGKQLNCNNSSMSSNGWRNVT